MESPGIACSVTGSYTDKARVRSPKRQPSAMGRPLNPTTKDDFVKACREARADDYTNTIDNLEKALRFKFSECQEAAAGVHHLQKELADREKSLLALSDRHELLCEKHEQLKMELGRAHAETEGAVKERKRLEATLKKVNIRSAKEDILTQSLTDKNKNLRDLQVLEDQCFARDSECKALTAQVHSLQGLLRQRDGKLAQTDSLLAQATHSGQLLGRNEASDAEKVLAGRLAELSDSYAMASKELRILKEQKLDAAFTRQEFEEPIHQEIAVLQAEVGRLKEKHEAAVKLMHEHARAAVIANTRLAQTNHMLRNSNVHRLRGAASPSASSPLKGVKGEAGAGPPPDSPAAMYATLKHEADVLEETTPLPSEEELLTGPFGLDVVPGGIYEQIQKEMVAVKAELKARERLISDKAAALMMYQKQTQNHERSKQSAQRVYDKELNELKREILTLKGEGTEERRSGTPVKRPSMRF